MSYVMNHKAIELNNLSFQMIFLINFSCLFFMTEYYAPQSNAIFILHVPPAPGLTCLVKHNRAGVLAQIAELTLLVQTQDVFRVEDGLRTETSHLFIN